MKKRVLACFVGIDGSGKTTVAKALHESLSKADIPSTYVWCGWRGFESWLFKPFAMTTKNAMIKHGNTEGIETAYAKIPFFDCLTWLDYFIRVCPLLVVASFRNTVVVTDRYVYDVIVGLHEAGSASHRIVVWLLNLFPRPTVVFYIKVPPELAYARKEDIPSLEFLYRTDEEKQALLKELPPDRVIMLDGTRPVQELAQSAFEIATALMT
jgi:thymidylate kinase